MSVHTALIIFRILVTCVTAISIYFITLYVKKWNWYATIAGRVIMGMAFCIFLIACIGIVGVTWPYWTGNMYLAIVAWGLILTIITTASVAMTVIRKPPDSE